MISVKKNRKKLNITLRSVIVCTHLIVYYYLRLVNLKLIDCHWQVISSVKHDEHTGTAGETFETLLVDKRMPLSQFKRHMEELLHVPPEFLLIYKKNTSSAATSLSGVEREWSQPHETLETLGDEPQVFIFAETSFQNCALSEIERCFLAY